MPGEDPFKRALRRGPVPVGTWPMSGPPSTAEALGHRGFDFLVLDVEHVPIGVPDAAHLPRALAGTPAQAVVRFERNDRVPIKGMLDAGARSLVVPFVRDADGAARAVAACKHPGRSLEGFKLTAGG